MPAWGGTLGRRIRVIPLIPSGLGLAGVYWHCPPPEMRVRPLQVEKPGYGVLSPRLQNATDSRISGELRWGLGTAVLGRGEVSASRLLLKWFVRVS